MKLDAVDVQIISEGLYDYIKNLRKDHMFDDYPEIRDYLCYRANWLLGGFEEFTDLIEYKGDSDVEIRAD